MSDSLFEIDSPDPARVIQACDDCEYLAWASDDALRVRGWLVFDGDSEAGLPLHIRVCPKCQRKRVRTQHETRDRYRRLAMKLSVQPELPMA